MEQDQDGGNVTVPSVSICVSSLIKCRFCLLDQLLEFISLTGEGLALLDDLLLKGSWPLLQKLG